MALPQGNNPVVDGVHFRPQILKADDASPTVLGQNAVPANAKVVEVTGVQNNADDFIILPALSTVPNGHTILVLASASSNFEMRTPATSGEKINNEDCDGTKEYLVTDTHLTWVTKISDTVGWEAHAYTAIGAVVTAVVPD